MNPQRLNYWAVKNIDEDGDPIDYYFPGMSLRDYFAAKAMEAIIMKNKIIETTLADEVFKLTAMGAYTYADAMLKAREEL